MQSRRNNMNTFDIQTDFDDISITNKKTFILSKRIKILLSVLFIVGLLMISNYLLSHSFSKPVFVTSIKNNNIYILNDNTQLKNILSAEVQIGGNKETVTEDFGKYMDVNKYDIQYSKPHLGFKGFMPTIGRNIIVKASSNNIEETSSKIDVMFNVQTTDGKGNYTLVYDITNMNPAINVKYVNLFITGNKVILKPSDDKIDKCSICLDLSQKTGTFDIKLDSKDTLQIVLNDLYNYFFSNNLVDDNGSFRFSNNDDGK